MADIKSVNTKLICNGDDLTKKLEGAIGEVEQFSKSAAKEISIPVSAKITASRDESGQATKPSEPASESIGKGFKSFFSTAGRDLLLQAKTIDPRKGFEWGKAIDSTVHAVSAGLAALGPTGIAAAAALEGINAAGQKVVGWMTDLFSVDQSARMKDDPLRLPEVQRQLALTQAGRDIDAFTTSMQDANATRGMSEGEAQLFRLQQQLSRQGFAPNTEINRKLDDARQVLAEKTRRDAQELETQTKERERLHNEASAKAFTEGLGGALGQSQKSLRDSLGFLQDGLINPDQFGRGVLNTLGDVERALGLGGGGGRVLAGAGRADSVEGVNAVLRLQAGSGKQSIEERLAAVNDKIANYNQQQADELKEIKQILATKPALVAGLLQ